jgi:hypothetical protein
MIGYLTALQRWGDAARRQFEFGFGFWLLLGALGGVGWNGAPLKDIDLAGIEID